MLLLNLFHAGLGFFLGFTFPLILSEVVRISPEQLKMSAMGYYQSFYALGILLGPVFAGFIGDYIGLNEVFYITAIITLFSIVFIFVFRNRTVEG